MAEAEKIKFSFLRDQHTCHSAQQAISTILPQILQQIPETETELRSAITNLATGKLVKEMGMQDPYLEFFQQVQKLEQWQKAPKPLQDYMTEQVELRQQRKTLHEGPVRGQWGATIGTVKPTIEKDAREIGSLNELIGDKFGNPDKVRHNKYVNSIY